MLNNTIGKGNRLQEFKRKEIQFCPIAKTWNLIAIWGMGY